MNDANQDGSNDTLLSPNKSSKGWICHLLSKTNADQKATFDMQPNTRLVMQLIKQHDPQATILNHDDEQVNSDEEIGTTAAEFGKFITYKTAKINNGRCQHLVYFTVRLSKPFHKVKTLECIDDLAKINVYLEKKSFRSTEYVVIGWLARIHPTIIWKDELLQDISSLIVEVTGQPAPPFDLVKRPKKFGNKRRIETKVFEIECDKQHEEFLTDFFIDKRYTKATDSLFVPAQLTRNIGPEAYSMALTAHTMHCNSIQTIPIFGLKPSLLHQTEPTTGTKPIYDTIVDMGSGTKIHRTARSEEIGKFIISHPKGKREEALKQFTDAVEIINAMDFAKNEPTLLYDGKLPRTGYPPRNFKNQKLGSYATDLCAAFTQNNTDKTNHDDSFIVLNTGRRYQGQQSPSYRTMVTQENLSQQSSITQATDQSSIDKMQTDLESMRSTMNEFIQEQRKINNESEKAMEMKINTRMESLEQNCLSHLTTLFTGWGKDADIKMQAHCETAASEYYTGSEKRRRTIPPLDNNNNNTPSASPSGSNANGSDDTSMAEAAT